MRTNICSVFSLCSVFLSARQSLPSSCVDQRSFPCCSHLQPDPLSKHLNNPMPDVTFYPSLPTSEMPPYKFLSPNFRHGPPKNECHQQAGFGIGKTIVARHSWWVLGALELSQALTCPNSRYPKLYCGWICSLFPGIHHSCPFPAGKERGL